MLPWVICAALALLAGALLGKLWLLRRGMRALGEDLGEKLAADTNTLLSVNGGDRALRDLAAALNRQLRQLRSARQRYLNGDRELRQTVTGLAHDLRTPLTAVCGYLELLEREPLSADARRYLGLIQERTEAMGERTEELFRYSALLSSPGELHIGPVDMRSVLEECAAGLYPALTARGITPEIALPEGKVVRALDRGALSRVFDNILQNALKYSDGDLTIRLSDGGEAVFSNAAAGLDGVQVGRLFDRYFSVEAARNASGLGLTIARDLTEQMGGEIAAAWDRGRLTVRVAFPAASVKTNTNFQ